jgi:hypothetical protein
MSYLPSLSRVQKKEFIPGAARSWENLLIDAVGEMRGSSVRNCLFFIKFENIPRG